MKKKNHSDKHVHKIRWNQQTMQETQHNPYQHNQQTPHRPNLKQMDEGGLGGGQPREKQLQQKHSTDICSIEGALGHVGGNHGAMLNAKGTHVIVQLQRRTGILDCQEPLRVHLIFAVPIRPEQKFTTHSLETNCVCAVSYTHLTLPTSSTV